MIIGLIKYKLAKRQLIKKYKDYIEFERVYLTTIFNHYFDYLDYIKENLLTRFEQFKNTNKLDLFVSNCSFYINEYSKNQQEIEAIFKQNDFKIRVVRALYRKSKFTGDDTFTSVNAKILVNTFVDAKSTYEKNYKSLNPHLMIKQYKMTEKLKRLQGDF